PSLLLSPHSPLPPEAKLLQVTFPVTELAVVPHLTLGRWRPSLRTGRSSPILLVNLGCGSRERIEGIPQRIGLWIPDLLLRRCFRWFFKHTIRGVNKRRLCARASSVSSSLANLTIQLVKV